jgi:hypothetical protein
MKYLSFWFLLFVIISCNDETVAPGPDINPDLNIKAYVLDANNNPIDSTTITRNNILSIKLVKSRQVEIAPKKFMYPEYKYSLVIYFKKESRFSEITDTYRGNYFIISDNNIILSKAVIRMKIDDPVLTIPYKGDDKDLIARIGADKFDEYGKLWNK